MALAAALVVGAGTALFGLLAGDAEHAGEPVARAEIAPVAPQSVGTIAKAQDEPPAASQRQVSSASQLETDSGVTVVRPGGGTPPGAMIINVPDALGPTKLAAAPDPRLVERGEFGPLPRIGANGERPWQVYARPAPGDAAKGRPRIAIVVGGLGLSEQATSAAITGLPGEMSLAFAPYNANLKAQISRAREAGHEVLLQMPMEPFDYPQNNPGPRTLTTDASASQNLERLHWALSRASGFVGVENFLGARFTGDEAAITPILKDLAGRGLIFVDDGSSARSIAPAIALSLDLANRRADLVVDAVPSPAMIDAALAKLETLAREKGAACGSASALPVTIERLAAWSSGLAQRGIDLVPVTATVAAKGQG